MRRFGDKLLVTLNSATAILELPEHQACPGALLGLHYYSITLLFLHLLYSTLKCRNARC
jgi:hypothetical protein